ncbi:outer membrane beta-barrel protein [Shewanella glacialipiscicola]|uniref:outer membrane beta-barrel protein n=1 Tax=Shewanella glacialipiscicola TaxID=614069 RepID=UPI003D7C0E7F
MKYIHNVLLFTALLPVAMFAQADVFVAPFGGYSLGGGQFDVSQIKVNTAQTSGNESVKIEESSHYGLMLGVNTKDPGNIYLLYSRQASELKSNVMFTPNLLTPLDVDYIHLGGTLYFPQGNMQPYVTASAGVTRMQPDDWSNETRFSMGIGGGVEYKVTSNVGLFADIRGYATFINSDSALFCDENECLWHITSDVMWQAQANLGLKMSF